MSHTETLKHVLLRFGADWVLWLLGLLSLASLILILERWLYYRSCRGDVKALAEQLDEQLSIGKQEGAIQDLKRSPSVAASVAAAGLRLAPRGVLSVREAMHSASALERGRLQKGLSYLGTIGNNAPFVGLFGTVIGVIHAFEELGHGDAARVAGAAAGQVASQAVMSAVAEALVATAVGILVAIPAVAAYNFLQRRVAEIISETEVLSSLVLAYLSDGANAPAGQSACVGTSGESREDNLRESPAMVDQGV
jgi:biopolymer transport protein ExbB